MKKIIIIMSLLTIILIGASCGEEENPEDYTICRTRCEQDIMSEKIGIINGQNQYDFSDRNACVEACIMKYSK